MTNALAGLQAVEDIKSLLHTNWKVEPEPEIEKEWEERRLDTANKDYVLLTYDVELILSFGLHADDWRHDVPMSIDIRTGKNETRLKEIGDEVARIIKTNVRQAGYALTTIGKAQNLNAEYRKVWRMVIDITLMKINP